MASQYITFAIIFVLGISLVIITNAMFLSMSEQFQVNIGDIEMTQTLKLVQNQILQNVLGLPASQQTIQMQIDLPDFLGQGFRYTIRMSTTTDGQLRLRGFTRNLEIDNAVTFSLGPKYTTSASGEFLSTSSVLTIYSQRISNNITLTIS
ncbi:MAG: hypothetical protein ACFFE8_15095 [Candidatus Heimdallarchaeota archaeon]